MNPYEADRKYALCLGGSRNAKVWKASEITLEELAARLEKPVRTKETAEQYRKMEKPEREMIKDGPGFFAGRLKGTGRRKAEVVSRSIVTLDADRLKPGFFEEYGKRCRFRTLVYTTHSHTPEAPRARLLFPLARDVTPEEYNAVARLLADDTGIEMFDPCSFEINQMMYWPTAPSDGEYIFRQYEGAVLDPDAFLCGHPGWEDASALPKAPGEKKKVEGRSRLQADPLSKQGPVGGFCRARTIQDCIRKYLPDIYEPTEDENRWTYIPGESTGGLVIYDDRFAYSYHATDPAGGRLLNAFDLVRVHRFPDEDEKVSYKCMCGLVMRDAEAVREMQEDRTAEAAADFDPEGPAWDEPLPLKGDALPGFPMDALTPVLRDYAAAIAESTQTAPDMAATGILAVTSAAMRNLYKVAGKADWLEPTNIYSLIIAEPSERKSAVISLLTKPLDEYVSGYNEEHMVEIEMSRAAKQKLENRRNHLISASKKKDEDKTAREFDDELQDVIEQLVNFNEKKPLRVYLDDTTPEKLTVMLAGNGNAISIISSEGGIFDILAGAYSSKVNIDVFLKAYSGERISVDRIMRSSVSVDSACLTILLSVQPVVIGNLMKNDTFRHRGLTARFLYTLPKSLVGERSFRSRPVPEEAYEPFRGLVYNILSEERGPSPSIIRLSREAEDTLEEFYNWTEKRLVDEFSMYGDWIGKLVGNTLRIAGILARSEVIRKDISGASLETDPPIVISGEIMRSAVRIGKYFFSHAVRAYSAMGVYSDSRTLEKTVEKIREKNLRTLCRRDLMRYCSWISSSDSAQRVLSDLEDFGYIRLISVDASDRIRGGRPKNPTFAVNPQVFRES